MEWDDCILEGLLCHWRRRIEVLENLNQVKIPRCYFPGYDPRCLNSLELHVFVDVSEAAYACAGYFRIVDRGQVRCALVSDKTKVAPLKPMSDPRLELQAAVIGVRLMKSIQSWIHPDQRKYRQFVTYSQRNTDHHKPG